MTLRCARVEKVLPGRALVRLEKGELCTACAAHGSCRPRVVKSTESLVEVADPIGVAQGERVEVHFPAGALWIGALFGLFIPGAAMLLGAALGWALAPSFGWPQTAAAATTGFSALTGAFAMGLGIHRRMAASERYLPKITRTLRK